MTRILRDEIERLGAQNAALRAERDRLQAENERDRLQAENDKLRALFTHDRLDSEWDQKARKFYDVYIIPASNVPKEEP